jgi:hypothetical protein
VPLVTVQVIRATRDARQAGILGFTRAVTKATVFTEATPQAAGDIKSLAPEPCKGEALAYAIWHVTFVWIIPPASCDTQGLIGWTCLPMWESPSANSCHREQRRKAGRPARYTRSDWCRRV